MQIDPTYNPEGNELAEKIIEQRASLSQLRALLKEITWFRKLAVVVIACHQAITEGPVEYVKLQPLGEFEYELKAATTWIRSLPPDTLIEIAIEILSEFQDTNE
ncbi:hypothetical protein [Microcoleus sp. K5-D4]|uniref:hypothetical protein n=1 Tax=Microcoleus sp. K5-D4 TaxID=2818801 RepID=UPI002FD49177